MTAPKGPLATIHLESPPTLTSLSSTITHHTKALSTLLSHFNAPEPTPSRGLPIALLPHLQPTRDALLSAIEDLRALLLGPLGHLLMLTAPLPAISRTLQGLHVHCIPHHLRPGESLSHAELAQRCSLDETELRRYLRMAAGMGLFEEVAVAAVAEKEKEEQTITHVRHTPSSAAIRALPALDDWIGVVTGDLLPASLSRDQDVQFGSLGDNGGLRYSRAIETDEEERARRFASGVGLVNKGLLPAAGRWAGVGGFIDGLGWDEGACHDDGSNEANIMEDGHAQRRGSIRTDTTTSRSSDTNSNDDDDNDNDATSAYATSTSASPITPSSFIRPFSPPKKPTETLCPRRIVEMSGGEDGKCAGMLSKELLRRYPRVERATVLELPDLIDKAAEVPDDLLGDLFFHPYDFSGPQPITDADVYIFGNSVFRERTDDQVVEVLRNQTSALKPGARIYLSGGCIPDVGNMTRFQNHLVGTADILSSLTGGNGHDRIESDWIRLLADADPRFKIKSLRTPLNTTQTVLEVEWTG